MKNLHVINKVINNAIENTADRQKILKAVLHYFYQDNTRSGAHGRYNLKYHLVWIPKYRRKFLIGQLAIRLKQILYEIADEYHFRIIATEVMPDHIHLLLEAPAKYALSQIAGIIKGLSSQRMRADFLPIIKRYIWKDNTLWARGYYIASVADQVTTGVVKEYIKNQNKHEDGNEERSQKDLIQMGLF
jgi:putative transposase